MLNMYYKIIKLGQPFKGGDEMFMSWIAIEKSNSGNRIYPVILR